MPLDFGHRAALGREDFLVAPSNQDAVVWIDAWPNWPTSGLVIYGPRASGKTHLAEVWRVSSGAVRLAAREVGLREPPDVLSASRALLVEDVDRGVDETALFHLYNFLMAERGSILLTGSTAPVQWALRLADLRSRLMALPSVAVGQPDDALIEAVMVKHFADRQLRIAPDVIAYVVPRLHRSFDAVRSIVAELDRAALAEGRGVTVPLARRVLQSSGMLSAADDA
jgi:chromosomal replication initiation ATPase DnaA